MWHFKFPKVVQAHVLGEVGILSTILLRVYSGTLLPIFIEMGSYLTDKEQKISWHSFLWDTGVVTGPRVSINYVDRSQHANHYTMPPPNLDCSIQHSDSSTNRKRVCECDFLGYLYLVRHGNLGPIFTVSEILQVFCVLDPTPIPPYFFGGGGSLDQIAHIGASLSRYLKLFGREIIFEVFQPV